MTSASTVYSVVREIGCGGFGVVHEVVNARGERFARKTFRPAPHISGTAHEGLKKRFKREVRIQAELGGQEIMPVLAFDLEAPVPWFLMPLAEKTYETQIADDHTSGSVDVDAVADVLNGLQFLHDLDFVHRDLNPKNILKHEGRWKLSDLGAVLPPTGHTVTLTENTVIFTEQYCSPEQRNDFHAAQPAADVFALGCVLHDIFGSPPRTPYSQQSCTGAMGVLIEKCTEVTPSRRPSIKVLRPMLLETLIEIGGHCKVEDRQAEKWLERLESIESWTPDDYGEFARFFAQLDVAERAPGFDGTWVYSLSTPFLTRLPASALAKIVERKDGIAGAIAEKYCEWVRRTAFLFHYADTVCARLAAMFDAGTPTIQAQALVAMIALGESHNRWYVMREMLGRCGQEHLSKEVARRFGVEIRSEEMEAGFRRCIREVEWDEGRLAADLRGLCQPQ